MVDPYTPAALIHAFQVIAASALTLGLLGLIRLEPRSSVSASQPAAETYTLKQMSDVIMSNPAAKTFFVYLLLLLVGILGQNILLEPFAGQAFGLGVGQTTSRVNEIWGTFVLLSIIVAGLLEGRVSKRIVAQVGNIGSLIGFIIIVVSGILANKEVFYIGITVLGLGTGLCTVANLSLMFDFTVPGLVGLYIGAWGFSNALSRLTGNMLAGVVFDVLKRATGSALTGYLVVFIIEGLLLMIAAIMLSRIDVNAFQKQAHEPSFVDKVALAAE
jgi:BCD family chlorophyll transporter-like MFS transporter